MRFKDQVMDVAVDKMVCRLCLKTPLTEFTIIGETAKQMLDVLLVKMDLDISTKPLMCKDCTEIVKRSLLFKSVCIDTEEKLVDAVSVKAEEDSANMCRFCMKTVKEGDFIPLGVLMERNTFADMIKEYMFHVNLTIIKDPLICLNCQDNMESYFKFLQNCRDTDEKINRNQRNNGVNRQNIMLVNVSETHSKYAKKELRITLEDIKMESVLSEMDNRELKIENDELIIKDEVTLNENTRRQEKLGDVSKTQLLKCDKCKFKTKYKVRLRRHYLYTHKKLPSTLIYQCNSCDFITQYENSFHNHMLIHEDPSEVQMYQCDICEYQTKQKGNLKRHMLVHEGSSDVKLYKCDSCEYQTNHKNNLKRHILVHKESSEVKMYQCAKCEYQAKHKGNLKTHMLIHMDYSKVQVYQCDICKYKTKHKNNLKSHLLIHTDSSDTYGQCNSCGYQARFERDLKKHMLVHKDSSEVQMYQCDSCEYQTKFLSNFKRHLLIHKKFSKVQMYQCDSCEFQTKYKSYFKRHMSSH